MESIIAITTILNLNNSLSFININRPIPEYCYANWMDDLAVHISKMLKVI